MAEPDSTLKARPAAASVTLETAAAQLSHVSAPAAALFTALPESVDFSAAGDTVRHHAIEHSDAYYTRLTIHRIGSYAILPLFGGEYLLGHALESNQRQADWVKGAHGLVAFGVATLFTVNTVTGVWNLVESRHDKDGRTLRWVHSIAMLAADAGFTAVGISAGGARNADNGNIHRNLAIGSMSLAALGTAVMWLRKDSGENADK